MNHHTTQGNGRQSCQGSEKGQTLALVAMLLLGLLAMVALVLDGGNLYLHRRRMQNAADAGAMAGVRALCLGGTSADVLAAAQGYAVLQNQADSCDVTIDGVDFVVTVVAHKSISTTFARVLGINQLAVSAQAEAKCGYVSATRGLAPISIREYSYEVGKEYTIWDTDEEMDPAGGNLSGSNRGWLSLSCVYPDDCQNGAAELKAWMHEGYPGIIYADDWVRPASGEMAAVIQQAYPGQRLLMPVFDKLEDHPPGGGKPFYHIVKFAAFDVYGVHATGFPKGISGKFVEAIAAGPLGGKPGGLKSIGLSH